MVDKKSTNNSVGKPEGMRLLGRLASHAGRYSQKMVWEYRMDSCGSEYGIGASFCENGNERLSSINERRGFSYDHLWNY